MKKSTDNDGTEYTSTPPLNGESEMSRCNEESGQKSKKVFVFRVKFLQKRN
jgi:hypothetical protein